MKKIPSSLSQLSIVFTLSVGLLSSEIATAANHIVNMSQQGCSAQYEQYLSDAGVFKKGSIGLVAVATVVNPIGILGGLLLHPLNKAIKQSAESTAKVYAVIQESKVNNVDVATQSLYQTIQTSRTDITSIEQLKNLVRQADSKQFMCKPFSDGVMTYESFVQNLQSGVLSNDLLLQKQFSSIQNPNVTSDKNIPMYQETDFSGVPSSALSLLQYELMHKAQYSESVSADDLNQDSTVIISSVKSNFKINQTLNLPLPSSANYSDFWTKLFDEKNSKEFFNAIYSQNKKIEKILSGYMREHHIVPGNRDNQPGIQAVQDRQAQGEISIMARYNFTYSYYELYLVKDVQSIDANTIKVTQYDPYAPNSDRVLWYQVDSGNYYTSLENAKDKNHALEAGFWFLNVEDFLERF